MRKVGNYIGGRRVYDNYDYESVYTKSIEDLMEHELENMLTTGKVNCLYKTKTITSTNKENHKSLKEVMIYPSFYKAKDAPKQKTNKVNQQKLNEKNARRRLTRKVIINFKDGDIWATFGWNQDKLPSSREEAQKEVSNFIKRINYRQRKCDKEKIKYIYVLAFDGYVRPHFHIIMSNPVISRDELEKLWGKCDRCNTRRVKTDDEGILTGISNYIFRNPNGTKKWVSSTNLVGPKESSSYRKFTKRKVEKSIKDYEELKKELERVNPGYKAKEIEIHHNGVNSAFYIYARLVRN